MASEESQIGRELRAARERSGITQEEAAHLVGVRTTTVGRWERGERTPSAAAVKVLMDAYARAENADVPRATNGTHQWAPNPALRGLVGERAYDVAIGYCRRLAAAGLPVEDVDEAERLLIDSRYAKQSKRARRELTEDEQIENIEALWEIMREALSWRGVRA